MTAKKETITQLQKALPLTRMVSWENDYGNYYILEDKGDLAYNKHIHPAFLNILAYHMREALRPHIEGDPEEYITIAGGGMAPGASFRGFKSSAPGADNSLWIKTKVAEDLSTSKILYAVPEVQRVIGLINQAIEAHYAGNNAACTEVNEALEREYQAVIQAKRKQFFKWRALRPDDTESRDR